MKHILFACTENKKRSQIAAAVFNHIAQEQHLDASATSAGTIPATDVDPYVMKLLGQHGIHIPLEKPRKLTIEMAEQADRIISFGCLIPALFPKNKFEEWLVDDPNTTEEYERVYDEIHDGVKNLIEKMRR